MNPDRGCMAPLLVH